MQSDKFAKSDGETLLKEVFAPWIQSLNIQIGKWDESQCEFFLPATQHLIRGGGPGGDVVCGQALGAAADTVSVLALAHFNQSLRPNTTTDFSIRFLRPLTKGKIRILVRALSNGKRLAVTEVFFFAEGKTKPGAHSTCTFAWLD